MKGLSRKHILRTAEKSASDRTEASLHTFRNRMRFTITVISLLFLVLAGRIIELNIYGIDEISNNSSYSRKPEFVLKRGDIVDRNGELLATNISTASLFINAKEIIEPNISAKKLHDVLPEISLPELETKFSSGKTFIWIKRHISPDEQQKVHNLGLPGLYFARDERRIYPQSNLFSHTIGFVDLDGNGISGLEKQFDDQLLTASKENNTLQTTLDIRVQTIVREELEKAIELNQAIGGSSIILNVNTGEVLSMVSLPDFDPHHIQKSTDRQRFNQTTLGVYEMGSTMKLTTVATAIDTNSTKIQSAFDVSSPLHFGKHVINDYSTKNSALTVPEILMYSSNRGTAQIIELVGKKTQREYIKNLGMFSKVKIELPEISSPLYPSEKNWSLISMITISYGYGLSITPLHVVKAVSAMVNGGMLHEPTIIKKDSYNKGTRVFSEKTSEYMRKMLRLIVEHGGGKRANVRGFFPGGKTGTSEVLVNGRYSKRSNLGSFVGAFPIHNPQYAVLVLIDQAKPNEFNSWLTVGGMVAAPVAGSIIKRAGPILGVLPEEDKSDEINKELSLDFTPSFKPLVAINR